MDNYLIAITNAQCVTYLFILAYGWSTAEITKNVDWECISVFSKIIIGVAYGVGTLLIATFFAFFTM